MLLTTQLSYSYHDAILNNMLPFLCFTLFVGGLKVHSGNPRKKSNTEIFFASARPQLYEDPDTFDNCDLSPVLVGGGNNLQIVAVFQYLGSILSRN